MHLLPDKLWRWLGLATLGALVLSLLACSAVPQRNLAEIEYALLPPSSTVQQQVLRQKVTIEHGQQQRNFILITRIAQAEIKLAALTPFGQPLFDAAYDGHVLTQKSYVEDNMPIKPVLAELQLSLWPMAELRKWYPQSRGWRLALTDGNEGTFRRLYRHGHLVMSIHLTPMSVVIENLVQNYKINVSHIISHGN